MFICLRKSLILLSFFLFNQTSFASNIDSLKILIEETDIDTVKLEHYKSIIDETSKYDLQKAKEYCDEAIKLSEKIKSERFKLAFYSKKANILNNQGEYSAALEVNFQALKLAEVLNDIIAITSRLTSIGRIYYHQRNYEKAIHYFEQSLDYSRQNNDEEGISMSYSNIGSAYLMAEELDSALIYHNKALELEIKFKNKEGIGGSWINIGNVYYMQNDYDKAIDYYLKAQAVYNEIDDKYVAVSLLINIGSIYIKINRLYDALLTFEKGLSLSEEMGAKDLIKISLLKIAETYAGQNEWKKAYEYYQKYSELKDVIFTEESSKQMAEMETKYETDKKEKENELLKEKNTNQELSLNRQRIVFYFIGTALLLFMALAFFVYRGFKLKQKANLLLEDKNRIIEIKNKDITDSINYAKNIQHAMLPVENRMKNAMKEHFVLFKPKDIVSGDFYWFVEKDNRVFLAVVDCTGHGVPGAFMSMIGSAILTHIVVEQNITRPDLILNEMHKKVRTSLKQAETNNNDGMDLALIVIDKTKKQLEFAGAMNPLYICKNGEIETIKGDKTAIGGSQNEEERIFSLHMFELNDDSTIYLSTDGFADQFGGEKGKKFMYKQFKELLLSINDKTMSDQNKILDKALNDWMGEHEQVDDICVVGLRV